ncbi:MAG: cobalamin biosynthesis protein [Clostridiales bacterium]|nr:cobalamin biosynthesis protein [Clostridiales bacterium]
MEKQMTILFFTEQGYRLAKKIRDLSDAEPVVLYRKGIGSGENGLDAVCVECSLHDWCADVFFRSSAIIFIGAAGIAVRTIAPFLRSKAEDPAVLVADEKGAHIISLLSGHLGGGNALTLQLAAALGADPVITTASDVNGKLAIDVWAQKNHLYIANLHAAKEVAARIVGGASVPFFCEGRVVGEIPPELTRVDFAERKTEAEATNTPGQQLGEEFAERKTEAEAVIIPGQTPGAGFAERETERMSAASDSAVVVSAHEPAYFSENFGENEVAAAYAGYRSAVTLCDAGTCLHLVPRSVILGIGCKKGTSLREIRAFVFQVLREHRIAPQSICGIASADLKADEAGLIGLAKEQGVPFRTFSAQELCEVPGDYTSSDFVRSVTGVDNVCERAAMASLSSEEQKGARFLCRKTVGNGVTVALLERAWEVFFV